MFVPSVTWNFCHALICSPTNIQAVGNQNARMDSFLDPDAIDVSLNVGIPTVFAANLFFSKKISSRKKKSHTQEKSAGLFFYGLFFGALKIPMISKIPGWVSLPTNDLQSTLSLPTRQIARNASAVPGCPFRKTSSFSGSAVFSGCCRLVTMVVEYREFPENGLNCPLNQGRRP